MRNLPVFLLVALCGAAFAQSPKVYVQVRAAAAFTGSCTANTVGLAYDTRAWYCCNAGTWGSCSPSPGGTATAAGNSGEVQLNIGGSFAGDADLTWDGTNSLTVAGKIVTPAIKSTGSTIAVDQNGDGTLDMTLDISPTSRPRITTTGTLALEGQTGVRIGADAVSGEEWFFDSYYLQSDTDALAGMRVSGDEFRLNVDFDNDSTATAKYSFWVDNSPNMEIRSGQLRGLDQLRLVGDGDADGTGEAIEFDVDGDETAEMAVRQASVGGRASHDCIDSDMDGTCETFLSPAGLGFSDGRVLGPVAILVVAADNHGIQDDADWDDAGRFTEICKTYKVPCTTHTPGNEPVDMTGDGTADPWIYGHANGDIYDWIQAGLDVGGHSAYHSYVGYDIASGDGVVGTSQGIADRDGDGTDEAKYGAFSEGKVNVTTGSATVASGSCPDGGSHTCAGWYTGSDFGRYALIRFDTDNDGLFTDEANYYIDTRNATTGSSLTLTCNFGDPDCDGTLESSDDDCDGDGTASETDCAYKIEVSIRQTMEEIQDNSRYLADAADGTVDGTANANFASHTYAAQGEILNGDDVFMSALAAGRVEMQGNLMFTDYRGGQRHFQGWGSYSPLRMSSLTAFCTSPDADLDRLLQVIAEDKLFVWMNVIEILDNATSCTSGQGGWKQASFEHFLSQATTLRQQGKLLILSAEEAARYIRSADAGQGQNDWNLIANSQFRDTSGIDSRNLKPFAWQTNGFPNPDVALDGTTDDIDGDGTFGEEWTWTFSGGYADYVGTSSASAADGWLKQCHIVTPGATYQLLADVEILDYTSGAFTLTLSDGDFYTTNAKDPADMSSFLDPVWWISGSNATNGFRYYGRSSPNVTSIGRHAVTAQFRVPDVYNATICYQPTFDSFVGHGRLRNPVFMRVNPVDQLSNWGQGNGIKSYRISKADPESVAGPLDYSMLDVWVPGQTRRSYMSNPGAYLFGRGHVDQDGTIQINEWRDIQSKTRTDATFRGVVYADQEGDGTTAALMTDDLTNRVRWTEDFLSGTTSQGRFENCNTTTGVTDADPESTTSGFGVMSCGSSSLNAECTCGIGLDSNSTRSLMTFSKLRRLEIRAGPGSTSYSQTRTLLGGLITQTDGDFATKLGAIGFWCAPSDDVDNDGTAGDVDNDGTCGEAGEDADDCKWYALTYEDNDTTSDDAAALGGVTYATITNTAVDCATSSPITMRRFVITQSTVGTIVFAINGTTVATHTTDVPGASRKAAYWGATMDQTVAADRRIYVDLIDYQGAR